jgi:hypothetical protein
MTAPPQLLAVGEDRAELDSWIARRDHLAVSNSPARELGHSSSVSLQDTDAVQIEL